MEITSSYKTAHWYRIAVHKSQMHLRFTFFYEEIATAVVVESSITSSLKCVIDTTAEKISTLITSQTEEGEDVEKFIKTLPLVQFRDYNTNELIDETLCCENVVTQHSTILMEVINEQYLIKSGCPTIVSIQLPDVIVCDSTISNIHVKTVGGVDRHSSNCSWYRSRDKINWELLQESIFYESKMQYHVVQEDVNCFLKFVVVPTNSYGNGHPVEVLSKHPVINKCSVPNDLWFEEVRHPWTKKHLDGKNFRVVSYNILSELYIWKNEKFSYCPVQYLHNRYRMALLMKEITGYKADILCLQEVDHKLYNSQLAKKFGNKYHCIYNRKGNVIPEGLLIGFKKSKFKKIFQSHIVLSHAVLVEPALKKLLNAIKDCPDVWNMFLAQKTSLQVVAVKSLTTRNVLLVANTHLWYNPVHGNIRLLQIRACLMYITKCFNQTPQIAQLLHKDYKLSILFCGDFNSQPDSAVYDFMVNGAVSSTYKDILREIKAGYNQTHKFTFKSACGTPKYTNYTDEFQGCLDYIFYDTKNLNLSKFIKFPDEKHLMEQTALPSRDFPSDHLALIAEFCFT